MENNQPVKIYLLPNLMTAGNLLCGFLAILTIFDATLLHGTDPVTALNKYQTSLFLILGAFVFDMLDGRVARMGGFESPFGIQFDSLADLISFGIAPALLMVKIVLNDYNRFGWFVAFIYLLCGALRLARFNCIAATGDKVQMKDFMGLPIPAAAGMVASVTLFLLWLEEGAKQPGIWRVALPWIMLFLSMMMFSNFKYPSFKSVNWRTQYTIPKLAILVILIALMVMYYYVAPAIAFMIYLFYGFFRPFVSARIRKEIEDDDENGNLPAG